MHKLTKRLDRLVFQIGQNIKIMMQGNHPDILFRQIPDLGQGHPGFRVIKTIKGFFNRAAVTPATIIFSQNFFIKYGVNSPENQRTQISKQPGNKSFFRRRVADLLGKQTGSNGGIE